MGWIAMLACAGTATLFELAGFCVGSGRRGVWLFRIAGAVALGAALAFTRAA